MEFMASSDFQETATADGKMVAMTPKKTWEFRQKYGEHGIETRKKIVIYRYFMIFLVDFYWVN